MRRRKPPDYDVSISGIQSRIRGFVYDSQVPDPQALASYLGCSAISDDVEEREEQESERRVKRIAALMPMLYAYAHSMAEATIAHQLDMSEEKIPSAAWKATQKVFTQIALNTMVGALAQLVDLDFLRVPKVKRKVRWKNPQ